MASTYLGRSICWVTCLAVLFGFGWSSTAAQQESSQHPSRDQTRFSSHSILVAQNQDAKTRPEKAPSKAPQKIDNKRRAVLMRFVRRNHPELAPLINSLKNERPAQYQAALRSLDKSVTSLNEIKAKVPEPRYQQAIDDWKLRSRIQLLSAQLSITDTPAKRRKLRQLITRQLDNRTKQLSAELERLNQRVERLDKTVTELESNRAAEIQRQMDTVVRTSERIRLLRQLQINRAKSSDSKPNSKNDPAKSRNSTKKKEGDE